MLLPSKVTSFKESSLFDALSIGLILKEHSFSVGNLFNACKKHLGLSVEEILNGLDLLYALNKIDFDKENLVYVGRN